MGLRAVADTVAAAIAPQEATRRARPLPMSRRCHKALRNGRDSDGHPLLITDTSVQLKAMIAIS